MIRFGQGV